jgi:hypothetical protein
MMSQMDLTKDESDWVDEIDLGFFCFTVFWGVGMGVFLVQVNFVMNLFEKLIFFYVRPVHLFRSESLPVWGWSFRTTNRG